MKDSYSSHNECKKKLVHIMIRRIVEFKLNGKIKITLGVGIGFRLTGPAPALLTHAGLLSLASGLLVLLLHS